MSGISIGDYSSTLATYNNDTASKSSSLEGALKGDFSSSTEEELMEVCNEFESYFTEQIFKALQSMVPENKESSNPAASTLSYFNDMLVQEYASNSTNSAEGGLGIAQMLFEQMKRNYNID